jgi:redox-sensitive bicupin YhaK (pirin superfamily)
MSTLAVRRSAERGYFDHGWLKTYHTFSFGEYFDPAWVEFGPLRVINDDRVAAGQGFGKHGHRDMEILTYLLAGELEHRDSMGNGSVIRVGELQRMSAGTGITHSEFNPSAHEPVHLLQIWIQPQERALPPSYQQKAFAAAEKRGRLRLIAAPDGADGALLIHQDAQLYAGLFAGGERAGYQLPPGRRAWLQLARGTLQVDDVQLAGGDGAYTHGPALLELHNGADAEALLFDLPGEVSAPQPPRSAGR